MTYDSKETKEHIEMVLEIAKVGDMQYATASIMNTINLIVRNRDEEIMMRVLEKLTSISWSLADIKDLISELRRDG